jgi:hypothetical protein
MAGGRAGALMFFRLGGVPARAATDGPRTTVAARKNHVHHGFLNVPVSESQGES